VQQDKQANVEYEYTAALSLEHHKKMPAFGLPAKKETCRHDGAARTVFIWKLYPISHFGELVWCRIAVFFWDYCLIDLLSDGLLIV